MDLSIWEEEGEEENGPGAPNMRNSKKETGDKRQPYPNQFIKLYAFPTIAAYTAHTRPVHKRCTGCILNVHRKCTFTFYFRIDRVYWPVYCPSTGCTQEVYWVYTERVLPGTCTVALYSRIGCVYWPVYCPSTACIQEVC